MRVSGNGANLVIDAPAKLNLFFEVLAKRPDGYHEIESLMCPIDLYDTLVFQTADDGRITLECESARAPLDEESAGAGNVPTGADNLVVRALQLVKDRCRVTAGANVRLIKRIPAAAGLGGGSSDAAAALVAANRLWGLNLPQAMLAAWGAELGSDVPFFLENGAAISRGRGERLSRAASLGPLWFVVVRPPQGLSTAAVYKRCRPAAAPRAVEPLLAALSRGDFRRAGALLHNQLQPAACELSPWIARLGGEFAALDCLGHAMSGSGSSYFGLCRHAAHARRIARRLEARGAGRVFAVRSCC